MLQTGSELDSFLLLSVVPLVKAGLQRWGPSPSWVANVCTEAAEKEIRITKSEFSGGLGFATLKGRDVRLVRGLRLEEVQLVYGLQFWGILVVVSLSLQAYSSSLFPHLQPGGRMEGQGTRAETLLPGVLVPTGW